MRCVLELRRILFVGFLCCGLAGCPGPARIPTAWVDSFASNGASRDEIRIALLECGSSVPGSYMEFVMPNGKEFPHDSVDNSISTTKCMELSGFHGDRDLRWCEGWIKNGNHVPNNLPSCRADAVIPKRSVENRLNSPYCKAYPKTRLCQPIVVSEAEWNELHKEEIEARKQKLEEVKRQGYSTSVGTGEAKYCARQARANAPEEERNTYFEKCLKEKFKVWNPFLSFE